jgi:adenylyltransferase/sulfurtransferase
MIRAGPPIIRFIFVSLHRSLIARLTKAFFRLALNPTSFLWHHLSMPKIHIPTPLRQYAGKQPAVDVKGSTVAEALSGLVSQHPDLRRHLYTEDGKLRAFVNVYLNDEDVRYLQKEATAVSDGDDISIVPSIAGGTEIEKLGNLEIG